MSKPWRLHEAADAEALDAARWYGQEREGLDDDFAYELRRALTSLQGDPTAAGREPATSKRPTVRRRRVSRFPYVILFVEREDEFLIVAIAHLRRRPGYWRKRLEG